VREALPEVGCLVVDDGSRDDTAEGARRAGAKGARLPYNLGVGGAMRLGFKYALENGYDNVVQIDADGQHDPRNVPELLAALDAWREQQDPVPTRPEAIRGMVEKALRKEG